MNDKKKAVTAWTMGAVVCSMVGLSFLAVPLYQKFCQVTGYGGTPKIRTTQEASNQIVPEIDLNIRFDANISRDLPWSFTAKQGRVKIKADAPYLAHYQAINPTGRSYTGTAVFNVTPFKAATYFIKMDCFCFQEQTLAAGEKVDMPVQFYIDPAIFTNPETRDIRTITLSYSFYPVEHVSVTSKEYAE